MTTRRLVRLNRVLILFAALPLCQLGACETGVRQVLASVINSLPATIFQVLQSAFLSPWFSLLTGGGNPGTTQLI